MIIVAIIIGRLPKVGLNLFLMPQLFEYLSINLPSSDCHRVDVYHVFYGIVIYRDKKIRPSLIHYTFTRINVRDSLIARLLFSGMLSRR